MARFSRIILLLSAGALAAPAAAAAYGWPVKPFNRQHAIRGYFDDPRITETAGAGLSESFHFGVDISAPDGTPVYAVAPGSAFPKGNTVRIRSTQSHDFAYWHIYPVVQRYQKIRLHQLIGYVVAGYGHVHFAEEFASVFVNPLRRGGLSPYDDDTRPTVESVQLRDGEETLDPAAVSGVVDVVAEAFDTPPLLPPAPWQDPKLSPALIRWRILGGPPGLDDWRIAVDFRWSLLPQADFSLVYAADTRQNRPNRPGRYSFYLMHDWDTTALLDGAYRLQVAASDMSGNVGTYELPFTVAN